MSLFATRRRHASPDQLDPLAGWLPTEATLHGPEKAERLTIAREWHTSARLARAEPTVRAVAAGAGRLRAHLRRDLGTARELARAPSAALLESLDLIDRMHGALPIARDVELHVVFDRTRGEGRFRARDRELLTVLLRALGHVARNAARARGYVDASRPLSPRGRVVLRALLSGDSEKEAAARLSLTVRSFHQYVVSVYRAFGVRSRAELISKFL